MPKRKRTKKEAMDRIDSIDFIQPTETTSPRLRALLEQLNVIEEGGKIGAKALIALDPLNRLADEVTVVPYPMIAIPAHEMYRLSSDPSFTIYIRGGETIMPTGGNVKDVQEVVEEIPRAKTPKKKRKANKRAKLYGKAFKSLAPKYKLKNGKWKKDGFKRCVRAAHAQVRKEMK